MTRIFLLNIGNTNVQYAWWAYGRVCGVTSCPTAEVESIPFPDDTPIAGACVVPDAAKRLKTRGEIFWIGPAMKIGFELGKVDQRTLGADRIANAAALAAFHAFPAMIFDFGTAITLEALDSEGVFHGGAILPGRSLARKALREGTALLPDVPLHEKLPNALGTNTADAIASGVDRGLLGAVNELATAAARELGGSPPALFATGGDRRFFLKNLKNTLRDAGADHTLRGVAAVWALNHGVKLIKSAS